ncbi:hypothetical protein CYLTODRAFT_416935 [Cylindrobasidium torrendii FP15055 ss-10]|uniref:C2 domain-containing protein n=1 Tax=Cylindrobasidium torrendii FP15055 ss-10 TaxID=1314674 RepID=A0A0D7BVA6_9AGAR|nr:hypothetical protein CYLTODRAFT_416935 [Cylindrobasidium torrendii FP15055 ss-10]
MASSELGTLVVIVLKGQHLIDKHSFYKQDVRAEATFGGTTEKTEVDVKGGQHPVWDFEMRFPIPTAGTRTLEVSAWCVESGSRSDELLGTGTVDITETLKTGEFDDWVPLSLEGKQRGEIYLEMTFFSNAPPPPQPAKKPKPAPQSVPQARPQNGGAMPAHGNGNGTQNGANAGMAGVGAGRHPMLMPASGQPLQRRPSKWAPDQRLARPPVPAFLQPGAGRSPPRSPMLQPGSGAGRSPPTGRESPLPPIPGEPARVPTILRPGASKINQNPIPARDEAPNPFPPSHQSFPEVRVDAATPNPERAAPYGYVQHPPRERTASSVYPPTIIPDSHRRTRSESQPLFPMPSVTPSSQYPPVQTYPSTPQPYQNPGPQPYGATPYPPQQYQQPQQQQYGYPSPTPAPSVYHPATPAPSNYPSPTPAPSFYSAPPPQFNHRQSYAAPPPQEEERLADPYLLARYSTPLPLPPGSQAPQPKSPPKEAPPLPRQDSSPPFPGSFPAESRAPRPSATASSPPLSPRRELSEKAKGKQREPSPQERALTAARIRKEQEERDMEMARQLDRELNIE